MTEVVQINPFLTHVAKQKHRKASISSAQPESRVQFLRSSSGKTRSVRDMKRFGKTHTHNRTHRKPCLGQRGAQAVIMSGTDERVAPPK